MNDILIYFLGMIVGSMFTMIPLISDSKEIKILMFTLVQIANIAIILSIQGLI